MAAVHKKSRFFTCKGKPQYGPGGNIQEAQLTLAEAREQGAIPAAATILSGLVREGLERTAEPDFFDVLLDNPRRERESDQAFVMRSYAKFESGVESAHRHAEDFFEACEAYARTGELRLAEPALAAFAEWWQRNDFRLLESRVTEGTEEFAGRVDLAVEHPEYGECIIDIRSQATPKGKFEFYVGMGMELAAKATAREGRTGNSPRIVSAMFSRDDAGLFHAKIWTAKEQGHMTRAFLAYKTLWYEETGYSVGPKRAEGSQRRSRAA